MKHPLIPPSALLSLGESPQGHTLPRQFRVTVWNLHKCKDVNWERDFLALCARTDLFLTQEIRLSPRVRQACLKSALQWQTAVSFLSAHKKWPTGIAAGSIAPAESIVCNNTLREPFLRLPKMTMRLIYPLAHIRLLVINLHAINFTGLAPFKQNLQNAEKLLEDFDGPVIVAGDFNAWNANRQKELQSRVKHLELQEVLFSPDERTQYFRRPVDYIFTRGLETVSSAVLPLDSSDHRPLTAVLRLPAPPAL